MQARKAEVRLHWDAVVLDAVVWDAVVLDNQYHKKQGLFAAPLLWIRAMKVSPSNFWAEEAPKVKWLNWVGSQVLSLTHAAGGAERNWSTHGFIRSDLRRSLTTERLERYVRVYRNMRLRDRALGRGVAAQKQRARTQGPEGVPPAHRRVVVLRRVGQRGRLGRHPRHHGVLSSCSVCGYFSITHNNSPQYHPSRIR